MAGNDVFLRPDAGDGVNDARLRQHDGTVYPAVVIGAGAIASAEAFGAALASTLAISPYVRDVFLRTDAGDGVNAVRLRAGTPDAANAQVSGAGQIATGEAFGAAVIGLVVGVAGIASIAAVGAPDVATGIAGVGQIPGAEAFGGGDVDAGVAAISIASTEALGAPSVTALVAAAGIASGELVGLLTVVVSGPAAIVDAGGIASVEAFGSPLVGDPVVVQAGGGGMNYPSVVRAAPKRAWTVTGAGAIGSEEAVGTPGLTWIGRGELMRRRAVAAVIELLLAA